MIEQFINRAEELEWLERESLKENAFLVIYGRRRVGKTELIKRFIKDRKHVYFLATRSSDRDNIESLRRDLVRVGRWWEREQEIDVVGIKRERLVLGECKWSKKKVGEGLLRDLEEKAELIQEENVKYYLFSRSGFTKNCMEISDQRDDVVLIGPAELERF